MILRVLAFDQHVIDVNFHSPSDLTTEYVIHQPLVGSSCIFEAEGHDVVAVQPLACDE